MPFVYVKTYSGKETQEVKTEARVDATGKSRGQSRGTGDLLPFSLV